MSTSTTSSTTTAEIRGVVTVSTDSSTQNLAQMYANLKAVRKSYKAQLKEIEDKQENEVFRSHSDMMIADMEWEDLDNKIYYLGKALKMIKRAMD